MRKNNFKTRCLLTKNRSFSESNFRPKIESERKWESEREREKERKWIEKVSKKKRKLKKGIESKREQREIGNEYPCIYKNLQKI